MPIIYHAGLRIQRTDDPSPLISFPAINLQRYSGPVCHGELKSSPFIAANAPLRAQAYRYTSDFTAAIPPISVYRKFYAPVDPRAGLLLSRASLEPTRARLCLYSSSCRSLRVTRSSGEQRREKERDEKQRNGQKFLRLRYCCLFDPRRG